MPIEKTIDGRSIKFPEGYDTPEGRDRIIAESTPYSKEKKSVLIFILARGIIKELGGDDTVWKDSNGDWKFSPHWKLIAEMRRRFGLSVNGSREDSAIAHPLFSELWRRQGSKGNSYQNDLYCAITGATVRSSLWIGVKKIANPYDDDWTEELRQKRDEYFREIVQLLRKLKSDVRIRSTSPEDLERRRDNFEEEFSQSNFANFVKLPENWRDIYVLSAIREIAKSFKNLDKEKVRRAIEEKKGKEEKVASDLIQRIIEGEDIASIVNEFETHLNETEDRHFLLLKLQKQIGNVPPDKRPVVVERFNRDRRLSEYIKELYGWKCQICGFTIEKKGGGLYAETHHLEPLSEGGHDSIENIIIVCPNHHALFDYGDVSILSVTSEKVEVLINNEHHTINRILLQ